jgi:phosphoglycolate phosphatase
VTPVVLFDLDGTLTDSQAGIVASYLHTLGAFGLDGDPSAIRRWIGPPLGQGLAGLGILPADLDEAVATYRAYFSSTGLYQNRLYEGTTDMLAALSSAGSTLGLATSKLTEFAETILDHFGIANLFSVVAGATRDGRRSHKADVLAHALSELGRPDPSRVALVGDREHDMFAAIEHGVHPVGVLWGYGSRSELTDAGAETLAATPGELTALLTEATGTWDR